VSARASVSRPASTVRTTTYRGYSGGYGGYGGGTNIYLGGGYGGYGYGYNYYSEPNYLYYNYDLGAKKMYVTDMRYGVTREYDPTVALIVLGIFGAIFLLFCFCFLCCFCCCRSKSATSNPVEY